MPDRDPEKAKQAKRNWYMKNKERVLQQKREKRAAQKKLKPPKPPKPPPTPEQIARARELNRLACNRYRAGHLAQVRAVNRDYYRRHRDQIVQQQRIRRARNRQTPSPFRKLRALADVCAARLLELDHGYARIAPAPQDPQKDKLNQKLYRERQYASVNGIEAVKALHRRRYHERMTRMRANGEYEAFKAKKTQEGMRRYHRMTEEQRIEVKRKNAQCQKNWVQKMKDKGTYEAYRQQLNRRRREIAIEKKKSVGRGGVASPAETEIREAGGIDSTSRMAMVGRGIGASLSLTVVALGLG